MCNDNFFWGVMNPLLEVKTQISEKAFIDLCFFLKKMVKLPFEAVNGRFYFTYGRGKTAENSA